MKIGILGCGYVGQAAAAYWKRAGHLISATTRQPDRVASLKTLVHHVYLLKDQSLLPFLKEQEAVLVSVASDFKSDYFSTYLQTAQQLRDLLPQAPKLKHILYTGSTSVYGDFQGAWVDEASPSLPLNENGRCLLQTEQVLLQAASDRRQVSIFRLGEIYGPQRSIAERLKRSGQQVFPGTGEQYTNLIHLTDIVRALDFALTKQLHGVFNLCNDFHVPRHILYDTLCKEANIPAIQWDPERTSPHGGNKRVSNQKLKNLGFAFIENDCPTNSL